jgi:HK97 family phage major capsid protein
LFWINEQGSIEKNRGLKKNNENNESEVIIMTEKVRELRQERAAAFEIMKTLNDKVKEEKRDYAGEEETTWQKANADIDRLEREIAKEERLEKLGEEMKGSYTGVPKPEIKDSEQKPIKRTATEEYRKAYGNYLMNGLKLLNIEEQRALQADLDISGGFLQVPEQMASELIMAVDNMVFMRKIATIQTSMNAESLGAVSLDNDPADPAWTSEIGAPSEDSTMSFGKRDLHPHPLAKLIKVSEKLLRVSVKSAETLVRDRLAYKFAITEENTFLNGTGVNQPLGVFTASDNGISTTYDVATGNTATSIQTDGLIEAKYGLKGQYWGKAKWIFHRDAIKQIRKLKTGEGDYIWQPGITTDIPDRILEISYIMSEYAPNTFSASAYVGIIGDFSRYWIADALSITIRRLDELYAGTNQIGFKGNLECDGMPVLGEAFRRVKLASS